MRGRERESGGGGGGDAAVEGEAAECVKRPRQTCQRTN